MRPPLTPPRSLSTAGRGPKSSAPFCRVGCRTRRPLRARRPTTRPNMVLPITAHPSFDKASHELGVEVRRVATTAWWEADPAAMDDAIDGDTAIIVGSVPSYGHGTIDDIPALVELAAARDDWMHVDGAVGGFLAPHMREIDP